MQLGFTIKKILAVFFEVTGLNSLMLSLLNRKYGNNYIRIVNYHSVPEKYHSQFEGQILWFLKHFECCDKEKLVRFLSGELRFSEKPGVIFTFDDGFLDNYTVVYPVLKKLGAVGMFMVSPDLIGKSHAGTQNMDYMSASQIRELAKEHHEICSHTSSHHRMNSSDTSEVLKYEIVRSREEIETFLAQKIDIFCWCGGEEDTYTPEAASLIRQHYRYGMMTNSFPITPDTDPYQLDRSNIEASWPMPLVKFQITGFLDWKLKTKRERVHQLTK